MPTDKYYQALRLTQNHHTSQRKTFSGQFTWKMKHRIKDIIDEFDVKSILDYGCGRGKQYENIDDNDGRTLEDYWGISPFRYDPGVKQYSTEPEGKFDLVICIQVLGSIPTADLSWVVDRLYNFSNKAIFVTERLVAARKRIYESIEKDMPRNMSFNDWYKILFRENIETPKMIMAVKSIEEGWKIAR